ncbi:ATP-binding protein [Rhodopirellula sp. MGV]|uniref:ATP-binding protein n=1 Tax=Rhodopirellula sp. MGV TaxID=2023130 RepID=UPI000B9727D2|nr:ATP-binding protein [Rhodopirellula sp. MGV]OYP33041.1 ATP-binding protein [Rhodopirellula sp. MGV]PNY35296.1 ATP-binding protein [Rhodopirellula baltica]
MSQPNPDEFEKLASFYLGRQYDLVANKLLDPLLMYDAKDLCTHALCVGMTGSGKTGLCLSLIEEAAIDGVPAICLDPKGDLANLLLTFPELRPDDFKPWLEPSEAMRHGQTLEQYAGSVAKRWRDGLASWGIRPERISTLRNAVEMAVYTPGSQSGLPLTVLKTLDAPSSAVVNDSDAIAEHATGIVSALMALLGINADPLSSPEHILIARILIDRWQQGVDVEIAELIRLINAPPFDRVGVLDLESFLPAADRKQLALRLNSLLASPAFMPWLEGDSLSIDQLLYTSDGKPKISILSIAHLTDREREFFVTILLQELVSWMRNQGGTSSLRAMFYMDEVAGYFPPVANPPTKPPMLTLLKQARAYGLGITLATQNPVDLDYKAMSNIGTWLIGRLQTERDKARVLEGLEGAAVTGGQEFDRGEVEQTLAALGNRVFLMNNVHDSGPVTFQTRWAMSFLAGPLSKSQLGDLIRKPPEVASGEVSTSTRQAANLGRFASASQRPVVPAGVHESFLIPSQSSSNDPQRFYAPALLGRASMHYVHSKSGLDEWKDQVRVLKGSEGRVSEGWELSQVLGNDYECQSSPEDGFEFAELPSEFLNVKSLRSLTKDLKEYLYRECHESVYTCKQVKGVAPAGSDPKDARLYFRQLLREQRDLQTERLREKIDRKIDSLQKKLRTAEERVDREASQSDAAVRSTLLTVASSVLGAFMGSRRGGVMTVARGINRASQQRDDVKRAEAAMRLIEKDIQELEKEFQQERDKLVDQFDCMDLELDCQSIPPRKSDLKVEDLEIVWLPYELDREGRLRSLAEF